MRKIHPCHVAIYVIGVISLASFTFGVIDALLTLSGF